MSTKYERDLKIAGAGRVTITEVPALTGIEEGLVLENPGEFEPGDYVLRIDGVGLTARIEPKA